MKKIVLISIMIMPLILNCKSTEEIGKSTMQAIINTSKGEIILELEFEKTPITVANFVGLAEGTIENTSKNLGEPFYNGIKFHRVIENFMIQGGDPTGTGRGDPGYKFKDEFHPELKHNSAGILSMANSGPGTNGSQFFITHTKTPWLDNKHSVFGHVVSGQEVVDAIEQDDLINTITIVRNGGKAENFDATKIFNNAQITEKKLADEKAIANKEALEKLIKGAVETQSGLKYIILEEGTGETPSLGQTVKVHYSGFLMDGTKFDSSYDRDKPFEFILGGRVIPGWNEGIQLLKTGAKAKFMIPPDLAYGSSGAGGVIPPNATLIFEVELLEIMDEPHIHDHSDPNHTH